MPPWESIEPAADFGHSMMSMQLGGGLRRRPGRPRKIEDARVDPTALNGEERDGSDRGAPAAWALAPACSTWSRRHSTWESPPGPRATWRPMELSAGLDPGGGWARAAEAPLRPGRPRSTGRRLQDPILDPPERAPDMVGRLLDEARADWGKEGSWARCTSSQPVASGGSGGKLLRTSVIRKGKEAPPRQEFFEPAAFKAVRQELRPDLRVAVALADALGWRMQSEVLPLALRQVDLQ
jgi:hypothetical protein